MKKTQKEITPNPKNDVSQIPLINFNYIVEKNIRWFINAFLPIILTISGCLILYITNNNPMSTTYYIPSFFIGLILALVGVIWLIMTTVQSIGKTWKEDNIKGNTLKYIKLGRFKWFYIGYGILAVVGTILTLVYIENDYMINIIWRVTFLYLVGALILDYYFRKIYSNTKND